MTGLCSKSLTGPRGVPRGSLWAQDRPSDPSACQPSWASSLATPLGSEGSDSRMIREISVQTGPPFPVVAKPGSLAPAPISCPPPSWCDLFLLSSLPPSFPSSLPASQAVSSLCLISGYLQSYSRRPSLRAPDGKCTNFNALCLSHLLCTWFS